MAGARGAAPRRKSAPAVESLPTPDFAREVGGLLLRPVAGAGTTPAALLATVTVERQYRDQSRYRQDIGRREPQNAVFLVLWLVA